MSEVHIEAKEVHVLHGFQLHWVAEKNQDVSRLGCRCGSSVSMATVVLPNVRQLNGVACGKEMSMVSGCVICEITLCGDTLDRVQQAVLWD